MRFVGKTACMIALVKETLAARFERLDALPAHEQAMAAKRVLTDATLIVPRSAKE